MRNFFTNNVNSILATISLHLLVVILFLWFKLGEAREEHKEQVMIEFNPEIKPLEDKTEKTEKAAEGEIGEDNAQSQFRRGSQHCCQCVEQT